jgi:hypothetical protein
MTLFTCKKCLVNKPIEEFSRNPKMASGRLSSCKDCGKIYLEKYMAENRERVLRARRERWPNRKITDAELKKRKLHNSLRTNIRGKYPDKDAARSLLGHAVRDRRIMRPNHCERCAITCIPHGHHEDYSKPLDVMWLCPECHGERHREINEERRVSQRIAAE